MKTNKYFIISSTILASLVAAFAYNAVNAVETGKTWTENYSYQVCVSRMKTTCYKHENRLEVRRWFQKQGPFFGYTTYEVISNKKVD